MKKIIIILIILLSLLLLFCPKIKEDKPDYRGGTYIIARRFTPPNLYELQLRYEFTNGLVLTTWQECSEREFNFYDIVPITGG